MIADPQSSSPILSVRNLRAGYHGMTVLHNIDLDVKEGECIGLLGHNGMGKTTLLRTIMGFVRHTNGTIEFDKENISDWEPWRRARLGIGYLPQGRGIFSDLSVRENLCLAFNPDTADFDESAAVERAISRFPILEPLVNRPGGTLSGGEQQVLALARALTADPVLLLLDEPTEGIQPSIIQDITRILSSIRDETKLTIVLVEQNSDFVHGLADRIVQIEHGIISQRDSELVTSTLAPKGLPQSASAVPDSSHQSASPSQNPNNETAIKEIAMAVNRPTIDQMRSIAKSLHFQMDDTQLKDYLDLMQSTISAYDVVDSLPDVLPPVKYPRTTGRYPTTEENPLNAWYVKCEVRGASSGPLTGKEIVLKDTICLSGIRMMNGASVLDGYVPDVDATIVTRILDAGGTIVGKANCEYLCLSGGSHTSALGAVRNPWKPTHSSGGSSSGCGALVGAGEVPMAIGGDQGGSVRIPSSWSGCYGLKPTHGLVPYSGVMSIEATIDTVGPMTATVHDNALLLEAIAGQDEMLDPRQYAPETSPYAKDMLQGVSGLKIGVVTEGFDWPSSEKDVDQAVRSATEVLKKQGASISDVSIPIHRKGAAIWTPICLEGLTDFMMHGNAFGTNFRGLYVTSLIDYFANWRNRADELSPSLKICMLIGEYFLKHYRGRYYGKSQNLSRHLRHSYDNALQQFDLLLMPTIPMKATALPPPDADLSLYIQRAFEMINNTAPFSVTGHPAMSVPCGIRDGLPVGMMLIGSHYAESTIFRAACAFESFGDWRNM